MLLLRACTWRLDRGRLEFSSARTKPFLQRANCLRKAVVAERTFPYDGNSPASFEELAFRESVPLDIAFELCAPEVGPGSGSGGIGTTRVAVPETTVDETNGSIAPENKIGGAREIPDVKSVSVSTFVKCSSQHAFRLRVLGRDARHHSRPSGLVDNVNHRVSRLSTFKPLQAVNSRDVCKATKRLRCFATKMEAYSSGSKSRFPAGTRQSGTRLAAGRLQAVRHVWRPCSTSRLAHDCSSVAPAMNS